MTTYRVEIDGDTVWSAETDEYDGIKTFPDEYRRQPETGEVRLIVDGEVVAVQTAYDFHAERAALIAQLDAHLRAADVAALTVHPGAEGN